MKVLARDSTRGEEYQAKAHLCQEEAREQCEDDSAGDLS